MRICEEDNVMEEVYATRRRISARCGNDPQMYIELIRNEDSMSKKAGLSFADYCLNRIAEAHSGTDSRQSAT